MKQLNERVKASSWSQKDWDRYVRIIYVLKTQRKTITEMSRDIGEYLTHVSACIWGVPGRRTRRIEEKIAAYLGLSWKDLFGEKSERVA